jgi:hypothetical protein
LDAAEAGRDNDVMLLLMGSTGQAPFGGGDRAATRTGYQTEVSVILPDTDATACCGAHGSMVTGITVAWSLHVPKRPGEGRVHCLRIVAACLAMESA